MKSPSWLGVALIVFGAVLLALNLRLVNVNWEILYKLWPLVLIFIGLAALVQPVWRWLVFVIMLIAVVALVSSPSRYTPLWWQNRYQTSQPQDLAEDYDSLVTTAKLEMKTGGGTFKVNGSTDRLINVHVESSVGTHKLNRQGQGTDTTIRLNFDRTRWWPRSVKHQVEIKLNQKPTWQFDLDIGAAAVDFNLRQFKVKELKLDAGAANIKLQIGSDQDRADLSLSAGASTVLILVPKEIGTEINSETGLVNKNFIGFSQVDQDTFRSPDYDRHNKKIYLKLNAGASNITVEQY